MNALSFAFYYSLSDFFSKVNRRRSLTIIIQVALLCFFTTGLVTFSGSIKHYLYGQIVTSPGGLKITVKPNIAKQKAGISQVDYNRMTTFRWARDSGGELRIATKRMIMDKHWQFEPNHENAYLEIVGRHSFTCTIDSPLGSRIMYLDTTTLKDPLLKALGMEDIFEGDSIKGAIVRARDLKELELKIRTGPVPCLGWDQPLHVFHVDRENKMPFAAMVTDAWFVNYWQQGHSGNDLPPFQSVDIYARNIEDLIPLSEAIAEMGYNYDEDIVLKVSQARKQSRLIDKFINLVIAIMLTLIFTSVAFSFYFVLMTKRREVGFMMAYGISRHVLNGVFLLEGMWLVLVGIILGFTTTIAVSKPIKWLIQSYLQSNMHFSLQYAGSLLWTLGVIGIAILCATFLATIIIVTKNPVVMLRE